jgi:RNA polymerase sigma-70 factor (ECF subfamily)
MPDWQAPDPDEAALVQRAIEGDREAFGDLYERLLPTLFRYVATRIEEVAEAEDVTEAVFVRAWEALDRYRPSGAPLRVWLFRIAHNLIIDRYRSQRPTESLDDEQRDPADSIEAGVLAEEEQRQLASALRRLEPDQREVLVLRFVNAFSHAEVAEIMGRSGGAVRVLQHRALNALRHVLREMQDHVDPDYTRTRR